MSKLSMADAYCRIWDADFQNFPQLVESVQNSKAAMSVHRGFSALFYRTYGTIGTHREGFAALAFPSRGFDWCYRINCLRNYLRKLERRPKWQHIRFTYDILSFLWSVQPPRVTPAYTGEKHIVGTSQGITPAHAGKRWYSLPSCRFTGDHPRACGEKPSCSIALPARRGSPPRMRGKVSSSGGQSVSTRITPAHAGKSASFASSNPVTKDHPRACGEKICKNRRAMFDGGSPPRMRGKVLRLRRQREADGITPAHAGKRGTGECRCPTHRDHPRACGEKHFFRNDHFRRRGSPPRMRGKETAQIPVSRVRRITPAHAGKSRGVWV